ncbi:DUF2179 domain-containing protein [Mycoplasma sp. U97]|uniref:DUF2179 domain-containing protein n=1 Tax=Mycoplasma tauri TaxID=547987 RepID=UPI001CBF6BB3|nr:DUF2179 domain-containing protein [Mycoplasma tauri]MBZ4212828.1 DUF2179 domain-containing protein [Mycoplasma tauri]
MYNLPEPDKNKQKAEKKTKRRINLLATSEINRVKVSEKLLHFSFLHTLTKFWQQAIAVVIICFLFSFFGMLLIQNTGLYGLGVDAISHGGARLAAFLVVHNGGTEQNARITFNVLFWAINFIINIPMFIFASVKINKQFALLTTLFMLFTTIFGIAISSIPGTEDWFIFGRLLDKEYNTKNDIIQITTWAVNYTNNTNNPVSVMFYGLLWAIIQGALAVALLIVNSSTAGFDIFVVWYSQKKFKNLGIVYIIIHIISLVFSNFIGTYIPAALEKDNWSIDIFFNASFASSFVLILVNGIVVDILFPKYRMVKIEIYTKKPNEIMDKIFALKDKRYAVTVANFKGGYNKETQPVLIINTMYIESKTALSIVDQVDPNAMIYMFDIHKMKGHVYMSSTVNKE